MKKSAFALTVTCFALLLLCTQCKKENAGEFRFFTRIDTAQAKLDLYVDGNRIGPLPYIALADPDGDRLYHQDSAAIMQALHHFLDGGRRIISARDQNGVTRAELRLSVSKDGFGVREKRAGDCATYLSPFMEDNAYAFDLYY